MIRATTPTFNFNLPIDADKIKEAEVTFSQGGENKLQKYIGSCILNGKKLSVTLTQEETLLFSDKSDMKVQLRVLTDAGKVYASQKFTEPVIDSLSEEVLVNGI